MKQEMFSNFMKQAVLYQGTSVQEYHRILGCLEKNHIKYKKMILDNGSQQNLPPYMFFLMPKMYLAPRAFRTTRNIDGECLKRYVILIGNKDFEIAKKCINRPEIN